LESAWRSLSVWSRGCGLEETVEGRSEAKLNPAIPKMIKNIESNDDANVRKLSATVIRYVDGPDIAKFRLEKAIESQSDPTKKARLKAAIEEIKGKSSS
jgi:hypothetical protein